MPKISYKGTKQVILTTLHSETASSGSVNILHERRHMKGHAVQLLVIFSNHWISRNVSVTQSLL